MRDNDNVKKPPSDDNKKHLGLVNWFVDENTTETLDEIERLYVEKPIQVLLNL